MSLAAHRVAGDTATWRDRLLGVRDKILSNAGFQRFAGRFALTRPIARQRATALFDLCAGFVYSQILLACVKLDLFEQLKRGPRGVDELAARLSLPVASTTALMPFMMPLLWVAARYGSASANW